MQRLIGTTTIRWAKTSRWVEIQTIYVAENKIKQKMSIHFKSWMSKMITQFGFRSDWCNSLPFLWFLGNSIHHFFSTLFALNILFCRVWRFGKCFIVFVHPKFKLNKEKWHFIVQNVSCLENTATSKTHTHKTNCLSKQKHSVRPTQQKCRNVEKIEKLQTKRKKLKEKDEVATCLFRIGLQPIKK